MSLLLQTEIHTGCPSIIVDVDCSEINSNMPAYVEEMEDPSGPMEAAPAGSPMVAAGHKSSKMEGLGQIHRDHSRDLLPLVDLRSSSLDPSVHSTFLHDCSRVGKEGEAGLGQKEAEKGQKS